MSSPATEIQAQREPLISFGKKERGFVVDPLSDKVMIMEVDFPWGILKFASDDFSQAVGLPPLWPVLGLYRRVPVAEGNDVIGTISDSFPV